MNPSSDIFDVDATTFDEQVIAASREVPVLVDFWAAWCGPCRALTPILERVITSYGGKVRLAKVDTDAERQLASDHGIRSLPTVRLFKDGVPVEEFMGAQPEAVIRELLDRHLPRASDAVRENAREMREAGDLDGAIGALQVAMGDDPDNYRVHADLTTTLLDAGRLAEARAVIASLPAAVRMDEEIRALESRIELLERIDEAPDREELESKIAADPGDCDARYKLSALKAADSDHRGAMDELLEILRRDRAYGDDAARKGLVSMFEILGDANPLVGEYRSRMASLLH